MRNARVEEASKHVYWAGAFRWTTRPTHNISAGKSQRQQKGENERVSHAFIHSYTRVHQISQCSFAITFVYECIFVTRHHVFMCTRETMCSSLIVPLIEERKCEMEIRILRWQGEHTREPMRTEETWTSRTMQLSVQVNKSITLTAHISPFDSRNVEKDKHTSTNTKQIWHRPF